MSEGIYDDYNETGGMFIREGMDEFCESMHGNISETLKLWGDVLIEGSEHGWSDGLAFDDDDLYYAMRILITICECRARANGEPVAAATDEFAMRSFIKSRFGIEFASPDDSEQ